MSWATVALALVARVVFSFVDPSITESSGLVDLGSVMVTMNDSGGDPDLFVVDPRTGRTVGHTTYADRVTDVEALAPGGGDVVWAGDIGDNDARRDSVQVYRVPVARGDHTVDAASYDLVYPDGAHDAESLVVAPDGRLYVITKGLLGGTAYAAPLHLDAGRPNRLEPVASVDLWATDAALFPDGKHLLVRGYDTAVVYTFPGFQPVASLDLPRQRQGEGVSIGSSGRIRLSSEGRNSPVLEVSLPDAVAAALDGKQVPPSSTSRPDSGGKDVPGNRYGWVPVTALVTGAAGAVLVVLLLLGPRRRSARRAGR
ncbi:hypothetical protein ACVW00_003175 [Marmoricola sp. URHA0025 HA25]